MVGSNSRSSLFVGLLVGAAAGLVAALLLAPASGKQSRELVRRRGGELIGAVRDRFKGGPVAADKEEVTESPE